MRSQKSKQAVRTEKKQEIPEIREVGSEIMQDGERIKCILTPHRQKTENWVSSV